MLSRIASIGTLVGSTLLGAPPALAQLEWQTLFGGQQDRFGAALALNGGRLAVGAPIPRYGLPTGHVYMFRTSASGWVLEQDLTDAGSTSNAGFGSALALTSERVLIGSPFDHGVAEGTGSATLFRWTGPDGWIIEDRLHAADGHFDERFGVAVALSGDLILIGASHDEEQGFQAGAVFAYRRVGDQWVLQQKLLAPGGTTGSLFGSAIALQGDRALVGARGDSRADRYAGAVFVYEHGSSGWSLGQTLTAADPDSQDLFGAAVALDGSFALIGAMGDDERSSDAGAVYSFLFAGGTWAQQEKILSTDVFYPYTPELFGSVVGLDLPRAIVGCPGGVNPVSGVGSGTAYSITRGPGGWGVPRNLELQATVTYMLGSSVALQGNVQAVGTPALLASSTSSVFVLGGPARPPSSECMALPNSTGEPARLEANGDHRILSNGILLEASSLPPLAPGYFLLSDGTAQIPGLGGGQGTLCLGPHVVRFAKNAVDADKKGYVAFRPDLERLPGGLKIQPGETWHFQLWFRDQNPGPTSNTTPVVSVLFE